MQQSFKTLIVTGSNKGIGYGIIENSIRQNIPFKNIILCSRDQQRGQVALDSLISKYPSHKANLHLGILDISKSSSIKSFREWFIAQDFGGVDVIWSNAAIFCTTAEFSYPLLEETFHTNFFGTIEFYKTMADLVNDNGKILFMGSGGGLMAYNSLSLVVQERFRT